MCLCYIFDNINNYIYNSQLQQGIDRVVVGRELSVRDIASVAGAPAAPEVEAFVHGALCVSYSGQCFSSEAWGGRSANRGQCAQACRLDYGLLVNGQLQYLGDVQYLLSPQDLAAIDLIPQMMIAGVVSFKIEGRLKGPEYVALTTKMYRQAVDAAWNAYVENSGSLSQLQQRHAVSDVAQRELRQVFARGQDGEYTGLTPGFLEGPQHQRLVRGRAPRHRGVYLGEVESVKNSGGVVLKLAAPVRRGDCIVFDAGDPQEEEFGGAIYDIKLLKAPQRSERGPYNKSNDLQQSGSFRQPKQSSTSVLEAEEGSFVEINLGHNAVSGISRVKPGQLIWKNKDPVLDARLKASYENISAAERRRIPVRLQVSLAIGKPLRIELMDDQGRRAVAETEALIQAATGRPLGVSEIEKAIGVHLGDEGSLIAAEFDWSKCDFNTGNGLFISAGAIKDARRRAVAALLEQQLAVPGRKNDAEKDEVLHVSPDHVMEHVRQEIVSEGRRWARMQGDNPREAVTMLRVLCRTKAQVDAAVKVTWLPEIVLDFLEVHGLKEACEAVRAAGKRVVVTSPRIIKPDEHRLWLFYLRLRADALLVRSAGLLHQLMEAGGPGTEVPGAEGCPIPALEGDFSLNAANIVSADLLLRAGLDRLAPTHDCNADQLAALARGLGPRGACLEAILHQNLPIFHTEHCVFARFLSDGNSFLDCGKPCEHNTVHLRASAGGTDHLVLADMGCRNTVFEGTAQSGLPFIDKLVASGFGCFRVELVDQPPEVVAPLLEKYKQAIEDALGVGRKQVSSGQVESSRRDMWQWMGAELVDANGRAQGVGTGSLEPRKERETDSMKMTAAAKRAAATTGGMVESGGGKKAGYAKRDRMNRK